MPVTARVLVLPATLACALLGANLAHAQPDSTHAYPDSTVSAGQHPDTTHAAPEPSYGAPPTGTPPPLRTRTQRGGPYNVVADRLEGGRNAVDGEVIMLIGHVTLSRAGTTVTSQTGRYVKNQGTIFLTGGVRAVDGPTTITALEATYNEQNDFLTLHGQVVVHDRDLVLTSDEASYDQTTGRAEMWSRVAGREKGRTMTADRIVYMRDEEVAHARGRVTARDSVEAVTLTADAVDHDRRTEITRATEHPKLVQDAKEGKGPTTLLADTITVERGPRIARADGHVHVTRDSLSATAARAVFFDAEKRGVLTGEPLAATSDVTVRGDTLEVFTHDRNLDRLHVVQNGRIDYRTKSGRDAGSTNTLTAERMDVHFTDERIDSLIAHDRAANEFVGAAVPGRRSETNRTEGELMRLYFVNKELDHAVVTGEAKGVYRAEGAVADSASGGEVAYQAGRITYETKKNRIRLDQDASLDYQDLGLSAPEVIFDLEAQVLEARGNPILADHGDTLRGKSLAYDLENRKGAIFGARTQYESGWYSGGRIRRLGDNVLDVSGARYTTCSLEEPHYAFESTRMKIYLKDKIIARPVVFKVKSIPLLALPFYVFPIRDDRHSGLLVPQVQFGFSTDAGGFVRNAGYFWAPNDYMDFTIAGDYYPSLPSWLLRGEARYKLLYKFEGELEGSYSRRFDPTGARSSDFRGRHLQQIDENTSLNAEANFTSSGDYTKDPLTGKPLAQRIDRFLTSNLTLNHRRPWASFNLFLQRREDLDANPVTSPLPRLTEQLPALTIAFPTRTIGRKPLNGGESFLPFLATTYWSFNARFLNQRTVNVFLEDDGAGGLREADSTIARTAYQHVLGLNDNRRLFGFVNVGPTFRYTQVIYDEDATGKGPAAGATWGTGVSSSFTLYGTTHGGIGPVTGFRHTISPSIAWQYQPDFPGLKATIPTSDSTSSTVDRFPPINGIGLSASKQSFLSFNVTNRWEAKVRQGAKEKTLSNLLTLNLGTAYNFLWRETTRSTPWQPILATFRVQPPNYLSGDLNLTFDPVFGKSLRNASSSVSARFSGGGTPKAVADIPLGGNEMQTRAPGDPLIPWNLSVSLSYGGGRDLEGPWSHRESSNLVFQIRPTTNWQLNYFNQIDLNERRIVAQEYSVGRNLDCWNMQFTRRFSGGTADYYFRIGIVNRPEVFIDRGTTGIGGFGGLGNLPGLGSAVPQ